jgi:hypothetical protein
MEVIVWIYGYYIVDTLNILNDVMYICALVSNKYVSIVFTHVCISLRKHVFKTVHCNLPKCADVYSKSVACNIVYILRIINRSRNVNFGTSYVQFGYVSLRLLI